MCADRQVDRHRQVSASAGGGRTGGAGGFRQAGPERAEQIQGHGIGEAGADDSVGPGIGHRQGVDHGVPGLGHGHAGLGDLQIGTGFDRDTQGQRRGGVLAAVGHAAAVADSHLHTGRATGSGQGVSEIAAGRVDAKAAGLQDSVGVAERVEHKSQRSLADILIGWAGIDAGKSGGSLRAAAAGRQSGIGTQLQGWGIVDRLHLQLQRSVSGQAARVTHGQGQGGAAVGIGLGCDHQAAVAAAAAQSGGQGEVADQTLVGTAGGEQQHRWVTLGITQLHGNGCRWRVFQDDHAGLHADRRWGVRSQHHTVRLGRRIAETVGRRLPEVGHQLASSGAEKDQIATELDREAGARAQRAAAASLPGGGGDDDFAIGRLLRAAGDDRVDRDRFARHGGIRIGRHEIGAALIEADALVVVVYLVVIEVARLVGAGVAAVVHVGDIGIVPGARVAAGIGVDARGTAAAGLVGRAADDDRMGRQAAAVGQRRAATVFAQWQQGRAGVQHVGCSVEGARPDLTREDVEAKAAQVGQWAGEARVETGGARARPADRSDVALEEGPEDRDAIVGGDPPAFGRAVAAGPTPRQGLVGGEGGVLDRERQVHGIDEERAAGSDSTGAVDAVSPVGCVPGERHGIDLRHPVGEDGSAVGVAAAGGATDPAFRPVAREGDPDEARPASSVVGAESASLHNSA